MQRFGSAKGFFNFILCIKNKVKHAVPLRGVGGVLISLPLAFEPVGG